MEKQVDLGTIVAVYNLLNGDATIPNSIKNLDLKFQGKAAFKISLLKSRLRDFANSAEETRTELIKNKYGVADAEGNFSIQSEESLNNFFAEYTGVLNQKFTISYTPLTLEDFEGVQTTDGTSLMNFTDALSDFFE